MDLSQLSSMGLRYRRYHEHVTENEEMYCIALQAALPKDCLRELSIPRAPQSVGLHVWGVRGLSSIRTRAEMIKSIVPALQIRDDIW